jgi:hypothetical protein
LKAEDEGDEDDRKRVDGNGKDCGLVDEESHISESLSSRMVNGDKGGSTTFESGHSGKAKE